MFDAFLTLFRLRSSFSGTTYARANLTISTLSRCVVVATDTLRRPTDAGASERNVVMEQFQNSSAREIHEQMPRRNKFRVAKTPSTAVVRPQAIEQCCDTGISCSWGRFWENGLKCPKALPTCTVYVPSTMLVMLFPIDLSTILCSVNYTHRHDPSFLRKKSL
ncbi:hypothetical protein BDY21DRAFT_19715 [Lineolata rhizophorae]|uniref:Uncharacterized protein n=1 Tax=Lineolata rhizophorae TaxID=578093 RepID=A0A6A6P3A0_9PEZI|nr:hypothetical protein BDY21DRAFT_19715 [Lineolata rhizophorae]